MIRPLQSDDALLADIHESDRRAPSIGASGSGASGLNDNNFRLWWLGQSGFLLQWKGVHVLLDPYLSDSLTRKYSQTDTPHVRMTELVIDPARLAFADIVTSTHNHTDHLDGETLRPLLAQNPALKLVVPEANRAFVAERLAIDPAIPIGVDDGTSIELSNIQLSGLASAHETIERDDQGRAKFLGYVLKFGGWTVYHSGDTIRYPGMAEKLRELKVDVALLPINGRSPERRVPGNLSGEEAAQLAKDMGAKVVIPCHFDMFEFNTASPAEFILECRRLGQPFRILRCGERWESQSLDENRKDPVVG